MNKVYYKKKKQLNLKPFLRNAGLIMFVLGLGDLIYVSFPLVSWQLYFSAFASESVISPVPHGEKDSSVGSILSASTSQLAGVDYTNAENWFPKAEKEVLPMNVPSYTITIPKIDVMNAEVSTTDTDLTSHMVQYNSTATPPDKGTAVVFGHSTLPQLYNPKDYTTILAKAYMLKKGDTIIVKVRDVSYLYKIFLIRIVSAEDTSVFNARRDTSYLTLVTCTPPGTRWKRLVLEARLQEL